MQIIEVIGLDEIQKSLDTLEKKTSDIKPLLLELANHLKNTIEESFANETSPDGHSWSPIKFRKDDESPDRILYDSGNMQKRLYSRVNKDSFTVGLNATSHGYEYAPIHQFGSKKKSGRGSGIVARPFMPIRLDGTLYEKSEKELEEIIADYFEFIEK
jgi:phage virion morphogenesis protein